MLRTTSEEAHATALVHRQKAVENIVINELDLEPSFVPHNDTIVQGLNSTYGGNGTDDSGYYNYYLDAETFRTFLTSTYVVEDDHEHLWRKHVYMMFYIGLGVLVLVVDVIRTIYMFYYSMRISRNIHTKMFECIVQVPIKFFDDNPSGMCNMSWEIFIHTYILIA